MDIVINGLPKNSDRCDTLWFIRTFKPKPIKGFYIQVYVYTCDVLFEYKPNKPGTKLPKGTRKSRMYEFFTSPWRV